jgi:hypothetical protein
MRAGILGLVVVICLIFACFADAGRASAQRKPPVVPPSTGRPGGGMLVPEMDASGLSAALAVVLGSLAVVVERRRARTRP